MADDPLFGFKPVQQPAPSDDPLMGFKPVQAAPPAGQDLGTTAIWNKPADASWSDYLIAHLAKPFQGADQAAQDYSRAAVDAATFGLGDRFQAYLTGNPLDKERAETAAASGRLGVMAPIVGGAMYAAGPGELGIAKGLGEAAATLLGGGKIAQWAGGVLGSGAEGAAAGAAGAAGHGESIGQGALYGGLFGAAGGVPGGVVGRGGILATPNSVDDLRAAAKTKYAQNNPVVFDGPSTVHPAFAAADTAVANANLTGQQFDLAKSTKAALADFRNKPQFTATDLDKAQGRFDKIASSPNSTDQDKWIAPYYSAAIEDVMKNGMPFNAPTGWAAETRDAADKLHGMAEDTKRLNDMISDSNVGGKGKGPDVGAQMKSWLLSDEGKKYAPPGTPQFDAANAVAATAQKPLSSSDGLTLWDLKHHLLWPGVGLGVSSVAGGLASAEDQRHSPWLVPLEATAGLGAGLAFKKGLGRYGALAQQRAIDAYRTTASTGQFQAPVQPLTPLRNAIRDAIYGRGAAGGY